MACVEVGEIEENREIVWRIVDFFNFFPNKNVRIYDSPSFSIASIPYFLRLHEIGTLWIHLKSNVEEECPVEYDFCLKKPDGSLVKTYKGINLRSILFLRAVTIHKSEFSPDNALTIVCILKSKTTHSSQGTEPLKLTRLDLLSDNFKDLFDDQESCDVTLKVQDKEYKAHKTVLMARSNVFASYFKHDTLEKQTGVIMIPDCDPDSFQEFLKYLYCGKLELSSLSSAMNLYITSDKYNIQVLKAFCVEYLMQSLTVDNVCEVAVFTNTNEDTQLFSAVQDFFNRNFCKIFETAHWEDLMKKDFSLGNKFLKGMSPKVKFADVTAEQPPFKKIKFN